MRPLADAQRDVLSTVPALGAVDVSVWDAAGLVLASPITAPHDVPPFTNSAMDGYAVVAADTAGPPVELEVVEDVAAGHVAAGSVSAGRAIKIMTGAPVPAGADAVVKVEDTEPGEGSVRVLASVASGTAVRPAGGDLAAGDHVFDAGTRLTARHLAVLASIGVAAPSVARRPVVALMSTGDEVRPPETAQLAPGQIRDSNRPLLRTLLHDLGVEVLDLGIIGDDEDLLRETVERAAAEADAVITSGGVSMGEYDHVKIVLRSLGNIEFWQVAMQPAKPFAFGMIDGTPLFGLPGNPVSSMVAFEQFARPALLHMMGATAVFRPQVTGTFDGSLATDPVKTVFSRVAVRDDSGALVAVPSGGQSSNVLSALARADAFAVIPVGTGAVSSGDEVTLEMFRWPESRPASAVLSDGGGSA